jgi:hypothetical protein
MAKKTKDQPVNIIHQFLSDLVGDHSQFNPGRHFYKRTGIRQKRWGQLYRNEKSPTIQELANLAGYFDQHITVSTAKRQLSIFKDETPAQA